MEDVGPTEGAIMGLMEFFVDPLLPSKFSSSSTYLEQLVAKQFHAVVLLYNYYHIKQHPELEFLEFESFCKLVVALKPSLLPYFKLMQREDYTEGDSFDKQLSLIEKAIIKSCNMCRSLDASKDQPVIKGWPITKIAVFLVDAKKENCCLFHSSITQGVWSVIEKDVKDGNHTRKQYQASNVGSLRQLAFLAVKEACGLNEVDLRTLETHVVYSIGKEKTAMRLYIMQCWKANKNMNLIPIKDALESMQGPLVVEDSGSWMTTSVVEYFHLLPYIDEVSDWFSRKDVVNTSQRIGQEKKDRNNNDTRKVETLENRKHFEGIDEVEGDTDLDMEVKRIASSLDHFETAKNVENLNRFPLKVEKVENMLHFEAEKSPEYLCSSQSHVKQPLTKRKSHHFETVEDLKKDCSYKLEQVPATSQHVEELKEVKYYKESPIEIKLPSKSSNHLEKVTEVEKHSSSYLMVEQVVKEAEIYQCSNLEVKPQPDTTYRAESVEEDQKYTISHLDVEPLSNTSHHFEAPEVVVSCSSTHVEEENPWESLQSSPGAMELGVGYCNRVKKEVPKYSSHHSEAAKDLECKGDLYRQVEHHETLVYKKRNRSQMNCDTEYPWHKYEKCAKLGSKDNMFFKSYTSHASLDGKSKILTREGHDDDQKQIVMAEMHDQTSMTGGAILEEEGFDNLKNSHEHRSIKVFSDNKMSDNAMPDEVEKQDLGLVPFDSDFEHLRKLQLIIASKEAMLSQAALKILYKKREILSQQHRCMADEIASCNRNIQTILSGEDDLAVKLQIVIDGCDDISLRSITTVEDSNLLLDKDMPTVMKRKRLSEANLFVNSSCQELDSICNENYWILPTYHVSAFKGGYKACVTIKEIDFECSTEGSLCQTPVEARNSAASNLLVELRSM